MRRDRLQVSMVTLLVLGVLAGGPGIGWAQSEAPAGELSARQVVVGIGAAIGSVFYVPFKALAICPGMALASGVAYVNGNRLTADHWLRVGCTGTYLVTPEMIRGQESFLGGGRPLPPEGGLE